MSKLTKNDLIVHDGDARVSDRRLAEVLGFNSTDEVRQLIRRNEAELKRYGDITSQNDRKGAIGRPKQTWFLNEHQASLVCIFARTERGADVREQVVNVFVAWRRGDQASLAQQSQRPDVFKQAAKRSGYVAEQVRNIGNVDDLTMRVTHMPIWSNGKRPKFWSNVGLRELLTVSHRQMTHDEAHALAVAEYPDTRPACLHRLKRI